MEGDRSSEKYSNVTMTIFGRIAHRKDTSQDLTASIVDAVYPEKVQVAPCGDCFFLVLYMNLLVHAYNTFGSDWASYVLTDLGRCVIDGKFSIEMWRSFCANLAKGPLMSRGNQHAEDTTYPVMTWKNLLEYHQISTLHAKEEGELLFDMRFETILKRIRTPGAEINESEQTIVLFTLSRRFSTRWVVSGMGCPRDYCAPIVYKHNIFDTGKIPSLVIEYAAGNAGGHYTARLPLSCTTDRELKRIIAEPFDNIGLFKEEYLGLDGRAKYEENLGRIFDYVLVFGKPVAVAISKFKVVPVIETK